MTVLGNEGGVKVLLRQSSHLYRLGTKSLHGLPALGRGPSDLGSSQFARAGVEGGLAEADLVFRGELATLAQLRLTHGSELAVLIIPWHPMVEAVRSGRVDTPDGAVDETLPLKHALSALQDLHIRYLDLTPRLTPYPLGEVYFRYDGHFTSRGHAIVAEAIRREWSDLTTPH